LSYQAGLALAVSLNDEYRAEFPSFDLRIKAWVKPLIYQQFPQVLDRQGPGR